MSAAAVQELCLDLERLWGGAHDAVAREGRHGEESDRLVYGEVLCESVRALLDEFARGFAGGACFVDVGSGRGKAVLTAACHPLVRSSHGVELMECHHACAASLLDAAHARGLLPAGASLSVSHADAFADASQWAMSADLVLCNCVTWPASCLAQLARAAECSRMGSIYMLVSATLPSAAFRSLGLRSARCTWAEHVTITVSQRQLHGSAWQRRRLRDGACVDYLLSDAAVLLHLLPLPPQAFLLFTSIGDCPLAAQLSMHPSVAAIHAFDHCPAAAAAAAASAPPKLRVFVADAEDVRFCCRADCPLDSCGCEEWQRLPASLYDAVVDQSCLDALYPLSQVAAHRSLACSFAALKPAGRLLLLSHTPPAEALLIMRGPLPGCAWETQIEHRQLSDGGFAYLIAKPSARSLLLSGSRVLPAPHERYSPACGRCSYAVCGRVMMAQPLYECLTCAMESLCEVCAMGACHAGHELARLEEEEGGGQGRWSGAESGDGGLPLLRDTTLGFCDCGWTGACRAL